MKVHVSRDGGNKMQVRVSAGEIFVVAPDWMSGDEIKRRLAEHSEWILQKTEKHDVTSASVSDDFLQENAAAGYFTYKKTMLCGKDFAVVPADLSKAATDENRICLPEKVFSDTEKRRRAVQGYIKKLSGLYLSKQIAEFGSAVSVCPTCITLRALKNENWIRCQDAVGKRAVTMDYRAIQLPLQIRKYLIVHTFCHFFEAGHDAKFWRIVSNYIPQYEICRKDLEKYAFLKDL